MGVNGIYGLSGSGLDIESMVKVGMMGKQTQYNKMQQTYTLNEWKKEAYLEIYDKINDYNLNTLSKYKYSDATNAREATSSNDVIKVKADTTAPTMNHTITVKSTATSAYLLGTTQLSSTKLTELGVSTGTLTFNIGADTDSGITGASTYASVSFSNTLLASSGSAKNLLKDSIISVLNTDDLISLDKMTVKNDNVYFTGLDSEGNTSVVSQTNLATKTALSFTVNDGSTSKAVDITYADLAAVLNNDDATFQDFVSLLNKKIDSQGLKVTASYDEDDGLTFTKQNAGGDLNVTLDADSGTLNKYVNDALYNAADSTQQSKFSGTAGSRVLSNSDTSTSASFSGGKSVLLNVTASTTVYDLVNKINGAGTNVRATFDASNNTFSFYSLKTGSTSNIAIDASDNSNAQTLLGKFGLKDVNASNDLSKVNAITDFSSAKVFSSGKDPEVWVDNEKVENINSNTFSRKGVTYDISNVTSKTTATVSVTQDREKIIENVKSFVEDYNTLLNDLYKAYRETPNSSYKPLTDAQKNEMTEEQIKKWEEKAKSGMLYHDSTLRGIIDDMRNAISDSVTSLTNSTYKTAYSLGISTTGLDGTLRLDEDKLRAALVDDPDAVYNVFAKKDTTDAAKSSASDKGNGIAYRLTGGTGSVLNKATKSISSIAGTSSDISDDSSLSTLMRTLQTRMSNFKKTMDAFETNLYKKYDAMEAALASLGSQLSYVSSMFA